MGVKQSGSGWRVLAPFVAFIFIIAIYCSADRISGTPYQITSLDRVLSQLPVTMSHEPFSLSFLSISIKQSNLSPPKLTLSVTNNYTAPITILKWDSPLDPLVLQLGHISLTPKGASQPLELPQIQIRRKMPPGKDALINLAPGDTRHNEVELREAIVPLDKLKGGIQVVCKGSFTSVWTAKSEEISEESLNNLGAGDAFSGTYETPTLTMLI
jgi:hypothetical protein